MRIVSWNCNGALRRKLAPLLTLRADIYVIQECEDPSRTKDIAYQEWAQGALWIGGNKNKGIGVFSSKLRLEALDWPSHDLELFIPFTADGRLTMLGVWTRYANSPNFRYIGQAWKYLQAHREKLPSHHAVVLGDFNSNTCWDEWDRWWNHTDVVRDLSEVGLESVYHFHRKEAQGKELQPTFFMYRKKEKPYHIDYAFASADIIEDAALAIGKPEEWLAFSDHMPIVLDLVPD